MTDFLELLVSVGEAGCIYGLVALAYLLVLRPTGIINFATGEWAAIGAFFAVMLITQGQLPWIVGLPPTKSSNPSAWAQPKSGRHAATAKERPRRCMLAS